MNVSGAFVVVWESSDQDGASDGVFAQRFNASGARQGIEFQVNRYTSNNQSGPNVAIASDGRFVVAWHSFGGQDGYNTGVFARRYDATGAAVGGEFQVNTYTASVEAYPKIAFDGDGDFVIAWDGYEQDGSFNGIFARRFSSSGRPSAASFRSTVTPSAGSTPPASPLSSTATSW